MILLTGFEPFGGDATNPSIGAARRAADLLAAAGEPATAVELPCVFAEAPAVLRAALQEHDPDLVVCTGLFAASGAVSLERVAINVIDARIPDNAGEQPIDVPVVDGGPAAYFSTLPIKRSLAALEDAGIPARISQSAGTYACNQVFYALMHELTGARRTIRGGFVHVPSAGTPGLDPEVLARALVLVAREGLDRAPDVRLGAGTIG